MQGQELTLSQLQELDSLGGAGPNAKPPHGSDTLDDTSHSQGSNSQHADLNIARAINVDIEVNTETEEREADGAPKFSLKYIKKMLYENSHMYYHVPENNDILYLNSKGLTVIRNMNMFPNLRCLFYEANGT